MTHPSFEKEKEYLVVAKATTKFQISNFKFQINFKIQMTKTLNIKE